MKIQIVVLFASIATALNLPLENKDALNSPTEGNDDNDMDYTGSSLIGIGRSLNPNNVHLRVTNYPPWPSCTGPNGKPSTIPHVQNIVT